jgi:hypothetical protein
MLSEGVRIHYKDIYKFWEPFNILFDVMYQKQDGNMVHPWLPAMDAKGCTHGFSLASHKHEH